MLAVHAEALMPLQPACINALQMNSLVMSTLACLLKAQGYSCVPCPSRSLRRTLQPAAVLLG